MSDSFITVAPTPSPPGENLQTFKNTIGGSPVHAEAVALVNPSGVPIGRAENVSVLRGTASTSAATLAVARPTRTGILIRNLDTAITIYVGPATVTSANGFPLLPGESSPFGWLGLIEVIADSGTPAYAAWDEYN